MGIRDSWRRAFAIVTAGAALTGGIYGYGKITSSPQTSGKSNLWISATGSSSCTRVAVAASYSSGGATDCDNMNDAYHAAATGDTVTVKCGTYGAQTFTTRSIAGFTQPVTFTPESAGCVTFQANVQTVTGAITIGIGTADWITINGFTVNSNCADSESSCVSTGNFAAIGDTNTTSDEATHIAILNNQINVGKHVGGCCSINLHYVQTALIQGNTIGPTCCGFDSNSSAEGIRIGRGVTSTPQTCANEACNVTITGNTFDSVLRQTSLWPTGAFPLPPGTTTCISSGCHLDGIHIWGVIGANITNNQFLGDECEDIFIESQNNALNQDFNIIGNTTTGIASQCDGLIGLDLIGTASYAGTFNIGFNEGPAPISITDRLTSTVAGFTMNIYGNYSGLLLQVEAQGSQTPAGTTCTFSSGATGFPDPNLTTNYQYNVWRSGGLCGSGPSADVRGTTPVWVNSSSAPATGLDMHKTGAAGAADAAVPCALLTIGNGCPSLDFDGDPYAAVADAGADQR